MRRFPLVVLFWVSLSGCFIDEALEPSAPVSNLSFELYLSRTALKGSEFEQYRLLPVGMYAECGVLRKGRAVVVQQGIVDVSDDVREALTERASTIIDRMKKNTPQGLAAPGDNSDLFDPGKFLLGFTGDGTNTRIDTSLDTVEGSATEREQNLRVFAELVRGILTKAPCKNEVFYGIGRKNP
jgi:hypothetical protein